MRNQSVKRFLALFLVAPLSNSFHIPNGPRRATAIRLFHPPLPDRTTRGRFLAGCLAFLSTPAFADGFQIAREVGGADRSPDAAAQNLRAERTMARLAAGGFKLDTIEEENEKIKTGLSSFSYDSAVNSVGKSATKKDTRSPSQKQSR